MSVGREPTDDRRAVVPYTPNCTYGAIDNTDHARLKEASAPSLASYNVTPLDTYSPRAAVRSLHSCRTIVRIRKTNALDEVLIHLHPLRRLTCEAEHRMWMTEGCQRTGVTS